jgi:hypothetical protein
MKICNDFELGNKKNTDSKMAAGECSKSQAFLEGTTDGICGTTFDKQVAHSLSKAGDFNHGYVIKYTKKDSPKSIKIVALCNEEAKDAKVTSANLVKDEALSTTDKYVFVFTGKEACKIIDLSAMQGFKKFYGAFKIVIGLAMVFVGSKFILLVIGFLVFVIFSTVPFVMLYNVGVVGDPLI